MSIPSLYLSLLSLWPASQDSQAPEPARLLQTFPLPAIGSRRASEYPPFGTLLPHPDHTSDPVDLLMAGDSDEQTDTLPQLVLEMAHRDEEQLSLSQEGRRLAVSAPAALLARVQEELAAVAAITRRPIAITVTLHEATDDADVPVVLGPDDQAAHGRGALLWQASARTHSGGVATFDALRWSRYVHSANVEVAQGQSISNPVLAVFGEGICVAISTHALANSEDLVLFVQFASGQRRSVDAVVTGVRDQPSLDLPSLETTFGTASARVPSGGAMQLVLRGHPSGGARVLLSVQARYPEPRAGASDPGGIAVLPISALTSSALRMRPDFPDGKPLLGDAQRTFEFGGEESGVVDINRLTDIVREAAGSDELTQVETVSGHVLVRGAPQVRQAALAVLQKLQERLLRNVVVRCTADLEELDGSAPFALAARGGQQLRLHDVALPSLPGRRAFVFHGLERNAVRTMLSEIAQEAASMSPLVETRQAGLWLSFCPPDEPDGDALDAAAQLDHLTPAVLRSLPAGGVLHLADASSLRAAHVSSLPVGKPVAVASGASVTIEGRSWRPALVLQRSETPAHR